MRRLIALLAVVLAVAAVACDSQADTVSSNLSKAADSFEIQRRIVFYNGITGEYLLEIEGLCSLGNHDGPRELSVVCKVGKDAYKKHFLGLSDNVTYFVEQTDAAYADAFHYRVIFRPEELVPNIDLQTSGGVESSPVPSPSSTKE